MTASCQSVLVNPFAALQASPPPDDSEQALDEGLFHVLYGVSLSLSSLGDLLRSPWEAAHEGDAQRGLAQLQVGCPWAKSLTVRPTAL